MLISDVEIPWDLINIIESNNFVVFAGAGVSMGEPTKLPSFDELVGQIKISTCECPDEGESCEKYLGRLKHKQIDVHKKTVDLLSRQKPRYNDLHEFIINLFDNVENIKIVTTNYDTMFEQVLKSKGIENINIFNAPALPLGDSFKGIVHIHGNMNETDSMILTDEDFGKAYITEGYVSRFLVKLFESYNVLFIGYSYGDTIVKYLTRAITTYGPNKRFILTESKSKEFDLLGIKSVCFGKGNFDILNKIVSHLGEVNHRGLLDWKNTICEYELMPPKDLSLESEIEYCLHNEDQSFILSQTIHGEKWFEWLLERKVFESIFNKNITLTSSDEIWLQWFINEFFGKNDNLIKRMILRNNNHVNESFVQKIIDKLANNQIAISNQTFCDYIILFQDRIHGLNLHRLIEISYEKGLFEISFMLFKKMFDYKMILRNRFFSTNDEVEYECDFHEAIDYLDITWEEIGIHLAKLFPIKFMHFVMNTINSIYEKYAIVGMANKEKDPLYDLFFSLERRHDYVDLKKVIFLLCEGVCQIISIAETNDGQFVKVYVLECLKSESILLRNLGIKLLRILTLFSGDEKYKLLIEFVGVYSKYEKEQVFLLIASIFNDLSEEMKKEFANDINAGNNFLKNKESIAYDKFNWCVWLEKNNIKTDKICEIKESILLEFPNFEERKHPERIVDYSTTRCDFDRSPKSETEIMKMDECDLLTLLMEFQGDEFIGVTKEGLYDTFCNCLKDNFQWTFNIISLINNGFNGDHPLWSKIISRISEIDYTVEQHMKLLKLFMDNDQVVKFNDLDLAWYLEKLIKKDYIKSEINPLSNQLFNYSLQIYERGNKNVTGDSDMMIKALNCSVGILTMFWVKLLSMETDSSKENIYYQLFEKILKDKSRYFDQVLCILGGNVRFFYYKNWDWCKHQILPFLTSEDSKEFAIVWEGIAYYSSELYKEFANDMQNYYLDAISRISELYEQGRKNLVRQYTLLMVYIVKDPLEQFIPKFFEAAEREDRINFIHMIKKCLSSLSREEKKKLWSTWLEKYWTDRIIYNIPIPLEDEEKPEMLNLCLKLDCLFPKAASIIVGVENNFEINNSFMSCLRRSNIIQKYPNDVAKLLISILDSNVKINNIEYYMKDLIDKLNITDRDLVMKLNEALLKYHIDLSFETK